MNILDHAINKRLIAGNFPSEILYTVDDYDISACDLNVLAEEGIKILRKYPILMYGLFTTFTNRVKEIEMLNRPELFKQEANVLINTGYTVNSLNLSGKLYIEASELCPAVTTVDKVLWYGTWVYYFSDEITPNHEYHKQHREMMFAWMYLFKTVQKKELEYGLAINIEAISSKTNIFKLIEADWTKVDKKYFLNLTDYGKKRLQETVCTEKSLIEKIEEDIVSQKLVADKTEEEWHLFVDVLNDLFQKEKNVICRINQAGSPKDKLRIINEYNSIIQGIERAKYKLDDEEIELFPLFDAINDRMQNASAYCVVKTKDDTTFRLHPAALLLANNPKTFNYLFLLFHQFRLNPGKETAKKFITLALSALKRNLGESDASHISIDDTIIDFCQTVDNFMKKNSSAIDSLSFEELMEDSAVVAPELATASFDSTKKDLSDRLAEIENSKAYDQEIGKMLSGSGVTIDANKLFEIMNNEEERNAKLEQKDMAVRIVVSLNIIYMFCEALRIILTNRHANIKIKKRNLISEYRHKLLRVDDKLVHTVYGHLGDFEMGMLEYREKAGIITTSLSEQEAEEENYRNSVFADVLKNSIQSLFNNVESQNSEQILKTKALIRKEVLRFPDCDDKERYTDWLDSICQRLSELLISNCKKEDDYLTIKEDILTRLGEKSSVLPESTVDSLTTAEMLYVRYASETFAEKGFDFSCISALYYQAFEEAYNKLIWKGYSDELNALEVNGQKFTDILDSCKGRKIDVREAKGYLDPEPKQRGYYIDYRNASRVETKVSSRCMYKSFAILLQNVNTSTRLEKFCDYISKIAGFGTREDMFNDSDYMRNFYAFTSAVDASADNRNNASHGGTFISVEQCKADKKTVLSELETVRSDSLGLIQQLIFIINK